MGGVMNISKEISCCYANISPQKIASKDELIWGLKKRLKEAEDIIKCRDDAISAQIEHLQKELDDLQIEKELGDLQIEHLQKELDDLRASHMDRTVSRAHAETQTEVEEEVETLPTISEVSGPEKHLEKHVLVQAVKYIQRPPVAQADGSSNFIFVFFVSHT
jgi:chromosome segregation ATPase